MSWIAAMWTVFPAEFISPHEQSRSPASLRFNTGRPDHLSPLFGIFDDEFAEVGG